MRALSEVLVEHRFEPSTGGCINSFCGWTSSRNTSTEAQLIEHALHVSERVREWIKEILESKDLRERASTRTHNDAHSGLEQAYLILGDAERALCD